MKLRTRIIAEEFFHVSLITYLILLLAETIKQGFVSYFFDINIVLGVVIISGILMVLTETEHSIHTRSISKKVIARDWQFFLIVSILGSFLAYYKIQTIGPLAFFIMLIIAVLLFLLSYLIMTDNSEE